MVLGYLGEFMECWSPKGEYEFSEAILNRYEEWGFYHELHCWRDRMTGLYDGDHYLCNPDHEKILNLWNQAGNIVQYKPY